MQVLVDVAAAIRDHYADREVGDVLADTILANLKQGRFDSVVDADSLVAEVMAVIRARVPDRHFDFCVRGEPDDHAEASPSRAPSQHGLRTVRILEDDIAYLEFDSLPGDSASMAVVEESLAALPEVRALVFDIRNNIGGSGDMVVLLCSHLLEARKLLYEYYDRSGGPPGEMRAAPYRRQFGPAIPVFVLTSGATMSAAEALAYILQDYGRATLVGEQTAGMANPSRTFSIGEEFELTVPFLLLRYGRSGGTFAGLGVAPDIAAPADSALDVALVEIRTRLGPPGP
jgi:C-terminal processing protease CtpA/Prc